MLDSTHTAGRRHGTPALLMILTCFLLVTATAPAQAQCPCGDPCNPADDCDGNGQGLPIELTMPVPDVGEDWTHVSGSCCHCSPTGGWFDDCWSLDINLNPAGLPDLDDRMPVLAADDGTAAVTYNDGGYGNRIIIDHQQGLQAFTTQYAHLLDLILIEDGQEVRAGQVLGYVSNTGLGGGANHLHFTIRDDDNDAAWTQDLSGQSIEQADDVDIDLTSDADQYFLDDFAAQNNGWPTLTVDSGIATVPAGTAEHDFQEFMTVRQGKAPYITEIAARLDPLAPGGSLRLSLEAYDWELPDDRAQIGIRSAQLIGPDTRQGWEAVSRVWDWSELPADTRFIKPSIRSNGLAGDAQVGHVRITENAVTAGGDIRLRAFNRGGANFVIWSVDDNAGVTSYRLLRATDHDGPYQQVHSTTPSGTIYSRADTDLQNVEQYFYTLQVVTAGGTREVGPIGPVDPYLLHDVPGLGVSRLFVDAENVPSWAAYPDDSFDYLTSSYGIINFIDAPVTVIVEPEAGPVVLNGIQAFFGGTLNQVRVLLREYPSGIVHDLGQQTNGPNEWLTFLPPSNQDTYEWIRFEMDRTDGDGFFHNAELQFAGQALGELCNGLDDDFDGQIDEDDICGCTDVIHGGSQYLFCNAQTSWEVARAVCQARNSDLVKIDDATENGWVTGQLGGSAWLGFSDSAQEGTWTWVDGSTGGYTNWSTYEPNGWTNENCGMLWTNGSWNDLNCGWDSQIVCERAAAGEEACVRFTLRYDNSNNCVTGLVDHAIDLYNEDTGQLLGPVSPNGTQFCIDLRRDVAYALREDDVPADACGTGYTVGCYRGLQLTDPAADGLCADGDPDCEELGEIDFFCGS